MRDVAIKEIVKELTDRGVDMTSMKALDFFAREGDWQTAYYARRVAEIHAWEIDPIYEHALRRNLPVNSKITIGDSHSLAKTCRTKFDLIVLDNPQGCYGAGYCEHFDALDVVLPLLKDSSVLIFNVKTRPFNYDNKAEWKNRRNLFYGREASELSEEFVREFYERLLSKCGFVTDFSFLTTRPQEEGLVAYTAKLSRTKR